MAGILDELIYLVKVNYAGGSQFNKLNRDVNKTSKAMKVMKSNMMGSLGLSGLFGGLSAGLAVKSLTDVASNLDRIKTRFGTAAPTIADANKLMEDSTRIAHDYGLKLQDVREGYSMWVGSTKGGSITFEESRTIYDNLAKAVGGMKMSSDEAQGALLAFSQMASKGKIQAEELRRQLANRMPGAFQATADAMFPLMKGAKERQVALNDALKEGKVDTSLLLKISQVLAERFGKNAEKAANGTIGSINRMSNAWTAFQEIITTSGFDESIKDFATTITALMQNKGVQQFAKDFAQLTQVLVPLLKTLSLVLIPILTIMASGKIIEGVSFIALWLVKIVIWIQKAWTFLVGAWAILTELMSGTIVISEVLTGILYLVLGITAPAWAIVAVIVAIGVALWSIIKYWKDIVTFCETFFDLLIGNKNVTDIWVGKFSEAANFAKEIYLWTHKAAREQMNQFVANNREQLNEIAGKGRIINPITGAMGQPNFKLSRLPQTSGSVMYQNPTNITMNNQLYTNSDSVAGAYANSQMNAALASKKTAAKTNQ